MVNTEIKPQLFNIIAKPTGAKCNLACDYCYFLKKERLYPGSQFKMADIVLESYISQYIDSQPGGEVVFTWQGGEPTLMGIHFFKNVLNLQRIFKRSGQTILNAFQTNGVLLNDDWGQFLAENQFLIGLSIDGPPQYHNVYRKSKTGDETHTMVLKGLEILKKHKVKTNLLACVNAGNVNDPIGVYSFFRDELKMNFIQFIPIVERDNASGNQKGSKLSPRSVSGKEYGSFLTAIYDEWIHKDVGNVFIQLFESTLGNFLGFQSSICIFSESCGNCLALEHNGDLYSCDHFVEPDFLLGNILESNLVSLVSKSSQRLFGLDKKQRLSLKCRQCDVLSLCNGDCIKNRLSPNQRGDFPISHLCEGYQSFFRFSRASMQIMASLIRAGKPVQDIMQLV